MIQVSRKRRFQYQQFTVGAPPIIPEFASWYSQLSEPPRRPSYVITSQSLIEVFVEPPSQNGWIGFLSEPPRQKPGLHASLQGALWYVDQISPVVPDVLISITAIETNGDIFYAALVTTRPSSRALVSIEEIPSPPNVPVSIAE